MKRTEIKLKTFFWGKISISSLCEFVLGLLRVKLSSVVTVTLVSITISMKLTALGPSHSNHLPFCEDENEETARSSLGCRHPVLVGCVSSMATGDWQNRDAKHALAE